MLTSSVSGRIAARIASRVDRAARLGLNDRHLEPAPFQLADRLQHRVMLDRRRHHVPARPGGEGRGAGDAEDGEVVALGRAAREDDVAARGADDGRDLLSGLFDGAARALTILVGPAAGVAEILVEIAQHHLPHARVERGGRGAVEIDSHTRRRPPKPGSTRRENRGRADPDEHRIIGDYGAAPRLAYRPGPCFRMMRLLDLSYDTPEDNLALDEALLQQLQAVETSGKRPVETLRFWESATPVRRARAIAPAGRGGRRRGGRAGGRAGAAAGVRRRDGGDRAGLAQFHACPVPDPSPRAS